MESSAETPAPLQPSALGTRAYWDECYTTEISNHAADADDEGTIWFSDSGAEEKMCEMLESMAEAGDLHKEGNRAVTSFCDLGTGNGHLLFSLRDDGWEGRMLGVDYSDFAIQLASRINAQRVAKTKEVEDDETPFRKVEFGVVDILSSNFASDRFDVLLDKGTFDAISLSSDASATQVYRRNVKRMLSLGGYLLITSCNWTEKELRVWLEATSDEEVSCFVFTDRARYPSFRFGGNDGQTLITLCFELVAL